MANLLRIQNRFDQLSSLIQEVEVSQEEAELEHLKTAHLICKSEIDSVLDQDFPFGLRWIKDLAASRGVDTPVIDEVYGWGMKVVG